MDPAAVLQLAHKHRPVFYLHPQEAYFPVDFNVYIDSARLKDTRSQTVVRPEEPFSAVKLGQWLQDLPEINTPSYTLFLPLGMDTPLVAQYQPNEAALTQVPLYVSDRSVVQPDGTSHLLLAYSHLYAYNGPESVLCAQFGAHYADLEHATLDLRVTARGDVALERIYTSRHNGGVWTNVGEELLWQTPLIRPLLFSSLNSHATYLRPGVTPRFWGLASDRCDYGLRWDTDRLVLLPRDWAAAAPEHRWTLFRGDLGDGHVAGFGSKDFLHQDEVTEGYGNQLWPCAWRC